MGKPIIHAVDNNIVPNPRYTTNGRTYYYTPVTRELVSVYHKEMIQTGGWRTVEAALSDITGDTLTNYQLGSKHYVRYLKENRNADAQERLTKHAECHTQAAREIAQRRWWHAFI
jgi:hypothetical protein